jgi:hypothetical protein
MNLAFVCLILLAFYFLLRLGAGAFARLMGGRFRPYRMLAERHHGQYESRGMYDPPTVSFTHGDSLVRVGLAPSNPGQSPNPRTRVVARFAKGVPFRLELAPKTRPPLKQEPKGTRPVTLGIPVVDRDFGIRTNDPEMARDLLSPDVLSAVVDLDSMVHSGGMLVSITPDRLLIQVDRNLAMNFESLDRAVNDALVVHDGLFRSLDRRMTAGIEIVPEPMDQTEVESEATPICKVCGEPIGDGPVVVCSSCGTPHHRDCWEYVGACSIYGCRGKVGTIE